jgi:hypothetical protein
MDAQPAWDDPDLDAGVMVKGALWLVQRVGVGNVFTKADIREAFPGVAQADRRIRDLRDYGWVLHTRSDDASLLQEQTRFVLAGVEVWDARARRAGNPNKGISAKARDEIMARDGYMCTVCGITGGEEYLDDPAQTALLSVVQAPTMSPGGGEIVTLATLCKRCKTGRGATRMDLESVLHAIRTLDGAEREQLAVWMRRGRRHGSRVDLVWSMYLNLSPEARDQVRNGK